MGNLTSAKGLPGRPVDLPNSVQNNKSIYEIFSAINRFAPLKTKSAAFDEESP